MCSGNDGRAALIIVPMDSSCQSTPQARRSLLLFWHTQRALYHHRNVQAVNCGDDNVHGKPAPDCFLATAQALRVEPGACLVIEDAPAGVQAAEAAGMRCVVVPSLKDRAAYPQPDLAHTAGGLDVVSFLTAESGMFNSDHMQCHRRRRLYLSQINQQRRLLCAA